MKLKHTYICAKCQEIFEDRSATRIRCPACQYAGTLRLSRLIPSLTPTLPGIILKSKNVLYCRKKQPHISFSIQWTGDNLKDIQEFFPKDSFISITYPDSSLVIELGQGSLQVDLYDFIVKEGTQYHVLTTENFYSMYEVLIN